MKTVYLAFRREGGEDQGSTTVHVPVGVFDRHGDAARAGDGVEDLTHFNSFEEFHAIKTADVRERALAKLEPEERKALGLE